MYINNKTFNTTIYIQKSIVYKYHYCTINLLGMNIYVKHSLDKVIIVSLTKSFIL